MKLQCILFFALLALVGRDAKSQNLVLNPNFDVDLSHWTSIGVPVSYVSQYGWPNPGAAEIYNQHQLAGMASDCFAIDPTQKYVTSAWVRLSLGELAAYYEVTIFVGPECQGDGTWATSVGVGGYPGIWKRFDSGVVPIPDTSFGSARIYFRTGGLANDLVSYDVDTVYFGPDLLFADGFGE